MDLGDMTPLEHFAHWYDEAQRAIGEAADVVALATADRAGRPSVRMVLYRGLSGAGVRFFTNYESRKGHDLDDNPQAALCFHWAPLERQVRLEGRVERLEAAESDAYFASRPYGSQLSAVVSPQSRPIGSRAELEAARAALEQRGGAVARPSWWGGYRLVPDYVELWRAGEHRLHHRVAFTLREGGWQEQLLGP
jgi:pyridoxamine 5'-phosphate oxidase